MTRPPAFMRRLPAKPQFRLLVVAGVLNACLFLSLKLAGKPMVFPEISPRGIVDLELAAFDAPVSTPKTPVPRTVAAGHPRTAQILNAWGLCGITAAITQTFIDFAFIAAYTLACCLGSNLVWQFFDLREPRKQRLAVWAGLTWWGILIAAFLDCVENTLMLEQLFAVRPSFSAVSETSAVGELVQISASSVHVWSWSAAIKFFLLLVNAPLVIIVAVVIKVVRKARRRTSATRE